jgi:DNA-directed RNA polymerase specialized sigma24 family protein
MPRPPIALDRIYRNNSNIFRYDRKLSAALRSTRYRPARQTGQDGVVLDDKYNEFCELTGAGGACDPHRLQEFQYDLEVFMSELSTRDRLVLVGFLSGYTQTEIAAKIGMSQPSVSIYLKDVLERFRLYYFEEESHGR